MQEAGQIGLFLKFLEKVITRSIFKHLAFQLSAYPLPDTIKGRRGRWRNLVQKATLTCPDAVRGLRTGLTDSKPVFLAFALHLVRLTR